MNVAVARQRRQLTGPEIVLNHLKLAACSVVPETSGQPRIFDVSKSPHADRLRDQIRALRERIRQLPAGPERDELLHNAKQDEIALRVIQWVTSPGHLPPPSDVMSVTRHRLPLK